MLTHLSTLCERLLKALFAVACLLLLIMAFMIGADVLTRNLGLANMAWTNEVSELLLSWMTLLSAPLLLRRGQHIRVDVLLQALPARLGWACEWLADLLGLACCLVLAWEGWKVMLDAYRSGAMITKTLETPEWWSSLPWVLCFMLMSIEFIFRMDRLRAGEHRPRHDAVSAS